VEVIIQDNAQDYIPQMGEGKQVKEGEKRPDLG
jgi:hypothetical protein